MPTIIAITNNNNVGFRLEIHVNAGPGHTPDTPQPIPKSIAPITRGQSIDFNCDNENFSAKTGF